MNKRHKYDYKATPEHAATKVVRMVGQNKRVLELGSGPGSMTRLLTDNQCKVTALELDPEAIKIVAQYCEEVYACDLNSPEWQYKLSNVDKYETIVAGDVLEHLYDPWFVLKSLDSLLAENGQIVVSLPHVGHNSIIACLLSGDFDYQPWGLLDKTHIRFFTINSIQKLFNEAGFKIIDVDFVVRSPEQTEFAKQWRKLSSDTKKTLQNNSFGNAYQIVIKATRQSEDIKEVQLKSRKVPSPTPAAYGGNPLLGYILSHISFNNQVKLKRVAEKIGLLE